MLILVDHNDKVIYPVDLKTSGKAEWDFHKSFIEWSYAIQARLYWRIILQNISKDPYFKEFKIDPYRFIVVNRKTLTPLVWKFEDTLRYGTLYYGKNKTIEMRDPYDIGKELNTYLEYEYNIPIGIEDEDDNDLTEYLNKL